jgi:hypothetical protein
MNLSTRVRTAAAAAAVASALAVGAVAVPPAAAKPEHAAAKKAEAKARRQVRFTAVGVVKSAASDGVVVHVKGGNRKDMRKQDVTFTLADGAVVRRDGHKAALADLQAGDHVSLQGVTADGKAIAIRVTASSRHAEDEQEPTTTTVAPPAN